MVGPGQSAAMCGGSPQVFAALLPCLHFSTMSHKVKNLQRTCQNVENELPPSTAWLCFDLVELILVLLPIYSRSPKHRDFYIFVFRKGLSTTLAGVMRAGATLLLRDVTTKAISRCLTSCRAGDILNLTLKGKLSMSKLPSSQTVLLSKQPEWSHQKAGWYEIGNGENEDEVRPGEPDL